MSRADGSSLGGRQTSRGVRERGLSLIEVTVAVALFSLLSLVIERSMRATRDATEYLEASGRTKERVQRVGFRIHRAVGGARRLFQRDAIGRGYLGALEMGTLVPAEDCRLPLIDEERPLGPDLLGEPRTGNVLLFVQEGDPVVCSVDVAEGTRRYMDAYYFVCCFPRQTDHQVLRESSYQARDLAMWYSSGYPSYTQIMTIQDLDQRASVVRSLYTVHGARYAWDPASSVESAFYSLTAGGEVAATPTSTHRILPNDEITEPGSFVHANTQLARTRNSVRVLSSIYTAPEDPSWKPHGFEVKICGPSGRRQVWMHIVAITQTSNRRNVGQTCTLIASVKDL